MEIQQAGRLGDIRAGEGHIAGLLRHFIDRGFLAQRRFDRGDHLVELHRLRAAEVEDVAQRPLLVVERAQDSVHDIVDKSVIPRRVTLAIAVDGLAVVNQPGELGDGQVRPLAGAVHGEEAQADSADATEMAVVRAHLLARHLRHGVGTDGLKDGILLGEGHFLVHAVDGGAAGKDELLHAVALAGLQQVEGALDIGVDVELRLFDGGPHASTGRQVDHGVILALGKHLFHRGRVTQVAIGHADAILKAGDIVALDGRVIIIIEIVNDSNLEAGGQKALDGVGSDEAGSAGDKNSLHDQ